MKALTAQECTALLHTLQTRFTKNTHRHKTLNWALVQAKLQANTTKLWSLHQMEKTGGEPDVVGYDASQDAYLFTDCAAESPKGRRSLCYDNAALQARKENKPKHNAMDMATEMGITILTENQYKALQLLENFDTKTSSWLLTPEPIRKLGGALFADHRFGQVFVYHNGAESYYAARGFRGTLLV